MIRLTVIKAPDAGTEAGSEMMFGPGGGTIGRSRGSTWRLIDKDFVISRTHAEIRFENGQYLVTDKSTNGLFLNNARKPLGPGESTPLRSGDHMHLGHYTLSVLVESAAATASPAESGCIAFAHTAPTKTETAGAGPIPDGWLADAPLAESAATQAGFREDSAASASWFENSLRMMLEPVVGSSVSTIPQSDLIALVTQLARKAMASDSKR